jgi:hypothetical protein
LRERPGGDLAERLVLSAPVQVPGPVDLRLSPVGEQGAGVAAQDAVERSFQLLDREQRPVQIEGDQVVGDRASVSAASSGRVRRAG